MERNDKARQPERKTSSKLLVEGSHQRQSLRGHPFLKGPALRGKAFVDSLKNTALRGRAFADTFHGPVFRGSLCTNARGLGDAWGGLGNALGDLLGNAWAVLGGPWGRLGSPWGCLGRPRGRQGRPRGRLGGTSLEDLGIYAEKPSR